METISGLGKIDRQRLSETIRGTKGIISVSEAAEILGVSASDAAKMLARWASKGWLSRVKRGIYVPIPLESRTPDMPLEDAWLIAERLFSPCYIGGWSAAEYWDLTEQIFRTIVVITTQKPRDRKPTFKGTSFLIRTIPEKAMFGLKPVWRKEAKVLVSDPARTIVDMLSNPQLGGGIRSVVDIFKNYLKSENNNANLLIEYASRLGNGAVFKRLGFLLERFGPDEAPAIEACKSNFTKGNSKLDPKLNGEKLITRWKLWVPKNWKEEH
ncbi:MAG: type IV toxin-antitoxin system AbiEi family antitoxin domain-containing protein [Deltaproteobacteria bacterium]|nr:type IV toxin-antitoxin system AbiEi family antitoxin domain-containing protein [Deltaproteobacteria bacterium]MBW2308814.1 type IV toxin-antitoxin system AbiEi family antitoxin domain-containing protein [Deltaproteobacteria bacterium]